MSKVKTRNEIKAELEAKASELAEAQKAHAEQIAAFNEQIETLKSDVEAHRAKSEELQGTIDNQAKELAGCNDQIETMKADAEKYQADIDALKTEKETLQAAVASPANVDASLIPSQVDQKAEDAEADRQEKEAKEGSGEESATPHLDEYNRLKNEAPRKARSYWREHEKEINDEAQREID